jgi:NAD-dependent dihydropyrimidine dehydrogenase PreA subunit
MPQLTYIPDMTTLKLDIDKCNGCTMCTMVCPQGVFSMINKRACIINRDSCMECGACARNCPRGALSVRAGVGCAYAIIFGSLKGKEASCGCDDSPDCC